MKYWMTALAMSTAVAACSDPPKPPPLGSGSQVSTDTGGGGQVDSGAGAVDTADTAAAADTAGVPDVVDAGVAQDVDAAQDTKQCPTCPGGQVCGPDGTCVCDKAKECAGKACGKGACGGDCPDTCKAPTVCAAASGACECPASDPKCLPLCKLDGTVKLPCRL